MARARMTSRTCLLTNTAHRIEWGDCDPAGIVFYPRYFEMFDGSTTALFSSARLG